jgi:DNA-binding response OmpR family regulator
VNSPVVSSSVISLKPRTMSAPAAHAPSSNDAHYKPRHLVVLVIEPSPESAGLMDRVLRRMPWFEAQVTLAGTVEAARFVLRSGDVDVVVMAEAADTDMLTFARALAATADGPPVIMTSPLLATEVEYEALSFGIAACIETSELTPRVIETYIRNALWRRAAQQPAAPQASDAARAEPAPAADTSAKVEGKVVPFHRRPVGVA